MVFLLQGIERSFNQQTSLALPAGVRCVWVCMNVDVCTRVHLTGVWVSMCDVHLHVHTFVCCVGAGAGLVVCDVCSDPALLHTCFLETLLAPAVIWLGSG
jgi:hypothetical protein